MLRARASVSWASADREPCDIAPDENRRVMASAGSTSSRGTGVGGRHELQQVVQLGGRPAVDQLGEAGVEIGPAVGHGPLEEVGGLQLVGTGPPDRLPGA